MHLNSHQLEKYCEHFQYLKPSESIRFDLESACRFCLVSRISLWACLSKNCGTIVCGRNGKEHLNSHLECTIHIYEESRRIKKFHSLFINLCTAQIWCIQCQIQIWDLDNLQNVKYRQKLDPFPLRLKILPGLAELISSRITGQLENSEGHKKIGRGLVGLFGSKYNHVVNSAIQFIAHCHFLRDVVLSLKISESLKCKSENTRVLSALHQVFEQIQAADFRAIRSDVLFDQLRKKISELLSRQYPNYFGYQQKDPFEYIIGFLGKINEFTTYYKVAPQYQSYGMDQWDEFYRKGHVNTNCLIYDSIESVLSLNYYCPKCKQDVESTHKIQFLKLSFPKKKRKAKQVQKQLAEHRATSPLKNRRKSLMDFFREEEFPFTIPELIIELLKQPLHKQKNCQKCDGILKKMKIHFKKLPDILMIQLARIGKDGSFIDPTVVEFNTEPIDLGPFTNSKQEQMLYDFQSAICFQKNCLYPVVCQGEHNKQLYTIRNQNVQLCKQKVNPYVLCYRKRVSQTARQKYSSVAEQRKRKEAILQFPLPDFWLIQLKYGIQKAVVNPMVCKHNFLKPKVQSKMAVQDFVSREIYEDLIQFYSGRTFQNEQCEDCGEQMDELTQRKRLERQAVLIYDKVKGQHLPYCMIPTGWVKKWSAYLYGKEPFAYLGKGHPFPPNIDNKVLVEGGKCKHNLVRNVDFKVINIYLWRFLKDLYGGGPEIRYKWKEGKDMNDEEFTSQIKKKVAQLKSCFKVNGGDSPQKGLTTSMSFIERSTFIDSVNNQSTIHPQEGIIDDISDQLD